MSPAVWVIPFYRHKNRNNSQCRQKIIIERENDENYGKKRKQIKQRRYFRSIDKPFQPFGTKTQNHLFTILCSKKLLLAKKNEFNFQYLAARNMSTTHKIAFEGKSRWENKKKFWTNICHLVAELQKKFSNLGYDCVVK